MKIDDIKTIVDSEVITDITAALKKGEEGIVEEGVSNKPISVEDYGWRTRDRWGTRLIHMSAYLVFLGLPWIDVIYSDAYFITFLGGAGPFLLLLAFIGVTTIVFTASVAKEDLRINVKKIPHAVAFAMISLLVLVLCLGIRDSIVGWIDRTAIERTRGVPLTLSERQVKTLPFMRIHATIWSIMAAYAVKIYWDHAVALMSKFVSTIIHQVPVIHKDHRKTMPPNSPRMARRSIAVPFLLILYAAALSALITPQGSWRNIIAMILTGGLASYLGRSALNKAGRSLRWVRIMEGSSIAGALLAYLGVMFSYPMISSLSSFSAMFAIFISIIIVLFSFLPNYPTEHMPL